MQPVTNMGRSFRSDKRRAWAKADTVTQHVISEGATLVEPGQLITRFRCEGVGAVSDLQVTVPNMPTGASIFAQVIAGRLLTATRGIVEGGTIRFVEIPILAPCDFALLYDAPLGAGPIQNVRVSGFFNQQQSA